MLLTAVVSCTQERMGMVVPAPATKPTAGEMPTEGSGSGGSTVDPSDPQNSYVNNPARLARIGKTPIIEIYYTEYTDASLFPTLEDIKCFTHVNVGHARFKDKKAGTGIEIDSKTVPLLQKMVAFKTGGHPDLKVKLMIGGWGKNADGFSMMARDPEKRKAFVNECVAICSQYGVDGFDIDWEYPTYAAKDGDYVNGASQEDYANFVTLFKEMREAMPDKILSYAASDSGKYTDNFGVLPYVDYINVMTSDEGNPPYHNATLYRSAITDSRCCSEAIDDIFHTQQGIPYQMMNFGLAFYGHGDGYKDKSGNAVYPSSVDYSMLEDIFFNGTWYDKDTKTTKSCAGKNYRIWDDVAKVPYLADAMGKMYASYEDIESINAKVEYLKSRNMLGAMIWEYRHDSAAGGLRYATKHAMDGNPDAPGRLERPDEQTSVDPPVMGSVEWTKKLRVSDTDYVPELSGLCLSKDGDFLWGCDDNGGLYKINFDGTFQKHWPKSAEMEALCIDPSTGDLYIGLEDSSNSGYKVPYPNYNSKINFGWVVEGAANMGNSGVEGIAWYKGQLLLGTQTGATLFRYTLDGILQEKKSLRDVCSTISEIAGLDYDQEHDWLWVIDSNSNKDKPQYEPYTIYLFNGSATKLLAKYYIGDFANWNPEAICVDKKNGCIWIGEDCGDEKFSLLHKVKFSNL